MQRCMLNEYAELNVIYDVVWTQMGELVQWESPLGKLVNSISTDANLRTK